MRIPKSILICILIAFTCIFGLIMFQNMCIELFRVWGLETPAVGTNLFGNGFWAAFIIVGVLPPIYEELIFRFGICKLLKLARFKDVFIIAISAGLFMVWHGSFSQAVYQFIMGVVLAVVFLRTNNIFWSMLIHFINNAFVVTYTYIVSAYFGGGSAEPFSLSVGNILLAVGLGTVAVLIVRDLIKGLPNETRR